MEKIAVTTYSIGDVLTFKKLHPCGGNRWIILRTGVDMKLQCETCKRIILLPRIEVQKKSKPV